MVVAAASLGIALALKEGLVGGPDFREGLVEAQTPLSLNPLIGAGDPAVHDVGHLLYRSLLRLDSSAYPRPDLAETYTVSRDGLTYRMVLSPNQRWSDGRPITASDVTATVVFVRSPHATDHALSALLQGVKVSVEGSDVVFVLPAPRASFPATLTQLPILPLGSMTAAELATRASHPGDAMATSGEYAVASANATTVDLRVNPYVASKPRLGRVDFTLYPNFDAAAHSFASGDVDAVLATTPSQRTRLMNVGGAVSHGLATFRFVDLLFNERVPGLDDPVVRQAVSTAVDRADIVQRVLSGGSGRVQVNAISEWLPWIASNDPQEASSKAAASTALAHDGWQLGPDGVRLRDGHALAFTLTVPNADPLPAVALEVRRQLRQIGVGLTLDPVPPSTFVGAALDSHLFQMALGDWDEGPDPDVSTFWRSNAQPPQGFNVSGGPVDPFLDQALDTLATATDPQARIAAAGAVTKDVANDVPAVFLYTPEVSYVIRASKNGVTIPGTGASGARFADIAQWTRS